MDNIRNEIIEKIKVARVKNYLTNCYSMNVVNHSQKLFADGDEFIFSYDDHGIQRLIYFVERWESVDRLLFLVEKGRYYLEYMARDSELYIFSNAVLKAKMMRMVNANCSSVFASDSKVIQYMGSGCESAAEESDAKEINKILWTTFHTEISHLLDDVEVVDKIRNNQFVIHKDVTTNKIDALIQVEVMPKKFYINQIVNMTSPHIIHAMLLNRLKDYVDSGGRYLYAWVEDTNIPSLKFHNKYGMEHDGMYSVIFCIER